MKYHAWDTSAILARVQGAGAVGNDHMGTHRPPRQTFPGGQHSGPWGQRRLPSPLDSRGSSGMGAGRGHSTFPQAPRARGASQPAGPPSVNSGAAVSAVPQQRQPLPYFPREPARVERHCRPRRAGCVLRNSCLHFLGRLAAQGKRGLEDTSPSGRKPSCPRGGNQQPMCPLLAKWGYTGLGGASGDGRLLCWTLGTWWALNRRPAPKIQTSTRLGTPGDRRNPPTGLLSSFVFQISLNQHEL